MAFFSEVVGVDLVKRLMVAPIVRIVLWKYEDWTVLLRVMFLRALMLFP